MLKLSQKELDKIRDTLLNERSSFERLSDYLAESCLSYKHDHPNTVRIIFSRDPKLKSFESIAAKIERYRQSDPEFGFAQITDIVALTVLCAYESDVQDFIRWLKDEFVVLPEKLEEAFRNNRDGHRAYHFAVGLGDEGQQRLPRSARLKCEIQVKTILQEAFDAKSHDLAYKPRDLEVGPELHRQFQHLSEHLKALDGQSEFVKDLILKEKQEYLLRRNVCLKTFIKDFGNRAEELELDLNKLPPVAKLAQMIKAHRGSKDNGFCKLVAYCALSLNHPYLIDLALEYATEYVKANPSDLNRLIVRGAIQWVLGKYDSALSDMRLVIAGNNSVLRGRATNNFVYFASDWQVSSGKVSASWRKECRGFAKQLARSRDPEDQDTFGFYKIAFGETRAEIDAGRRVMSKVLAARPKDNDFPLCELFYEFHEFVAVNKLTKLVKRPTL